jgi:DNA-binding transcriptional MerR regulator
VTTYSIGGIAERSGFTASALRYYEEIGLVSPAERTAAGYRRYDESTLTRLAFIDRAKHLGCSLDEIIDLVAVWDGTCEPVQRRFHDLVTTKLAETQRQIDELTQLQVQLRDAARQLAGPTSNGTCGGECACIRAAGPVSTAVRRRTSRRSA